MTSKNAFRVVAALCVCLTGCETVPTAPVQDFVTASTTLVQAESDYFDQIQAASDASHTLLAEAIYVGGHKKFADIAPELSKRDDFSKAKAARLAVLNQLKNDAQQLAAITTAATGTWIADDAKNTATNASKLLSDATGVKLSSSEAGILQTAVNQLATAIVDNETAGDIRTLAVAAREPITQIAQMVKSDNANIEITQFASGLGADQKAAMLSVLNYLYADKRVNAAERFQAVEAWRAWKPGLVTKGAAIAEALDKLEKANDALAANQDMSASALMQQALTLAQNASGVAAPAK